MSDYNIYSRIGPTILFEKELGIRSESNATVFSRIAAARIRITDLSTTSATTNRNEILTAVEMKITRITKNSGFVEAAEVDCATKREVVVGEE